MSGFRRMLPVIAAVLCLVAVDTCIAGGRNRRHRRRGSKPLKHYRVNAKVTKVKKIGSATGADDLSSRHSQAFTGKADGSSSPMQDSDFALLRAAAAETQAARTNETGGLFSQP